MSYSRRSRYASRSPSPYRDARSASRSLSRSSTRSRSPDFSDVKNPGNNLYVTGLSSRITKNELEKHFASEGKVIDVHLVVDPWSRGSRGFGFVTMATIEDANRCIKYLDGSVLEGRVITVQKARRRRGRTPTPGRYLGARTFHSRRRSPSDSPYYRSRYRSPSYSCERDRSYSPYYRRHRSYSRSRSPYYRRHQSYSRSRSPYYRFHRSYSSSRSPYYRRHRSYSRSRSPYYRRQSYSRSRSPCYRRRSYSRSSDAPARRWYSCSCDSRSYSLVCSGSPRYHRDYYRSDSQNISARVRRRSRSDSPGGGSRSYSRSISPRPITSRSFTRSHSPKPKHSRRSYSRSHSQLMRRAKTSMSSWSRRYSRESYSHSHRMGSSSKSASSSPSRSC